jgi:phosphatidylserine/phosphatidylglycerophosphate/cardiolipin synthase-like enzyme
MSDIQGRGTGMRRRWVVVACFGPIACLVAVALGQSSALAATAGYYQLVQYPGAGFNGIRTQIAHARRSIDMEMYELADPATERGLVAASHRGVRVRVLLNRDFSGAEVNGPAVRYLKTRGVAVRWAPRGYIFHIKVTSIDGSVSDVSTANLTAKYYATTRDAEIIDRNPVQVHAIESTFAHDWTAAPAGTPSTQTVQAPGLVWSPNTGTGTAENALVTQISAAQTAVDFTSEELSDPAVYGALAADAQRGVACRIVMTRSPDWTPAFEALENAGCQVHVFSDSSTALYIHEKLIVKDPGQSDESMFLGSQNASVTSLTRNRELGIVLTGAGGGARAIAAASATFDSDFVQATAWSAPVTAPTPTPVPAPVPAPTPTPAPVSCTPLSSTGNCYEPGEYCSDADHGLIGVAGDGESIVCEYNNGWRWEPE